MQICCNGREYGYWTVGITYIKSLHYPLTVHLKSGVLHVFNVGEGKWHNCKQRSRPSLLGTSEWSRESWTVGDSRGWCLRELWTSLGGSNVMEAVEWCRSFEMELGCSDICQHLDDGQFLITTMTNFLWRLQFILQVMIQCMLKFWSFGDNY